jgi:rubredoxin
MKKGADAPASPTKTTQLSLMPENTSNTPQVNRRDLDNDYLCPACGARYLPDLFALECEVCAAEDHTVEAPF